MKVSNNKRRLISKKNILILVIFIATILIANNLNQPPMINSNYIGDSGLFSIDLDHSPSFGVTFVDLQVMVFEKLGFGYNLFNTINIINSTITFFCAILLASAVFKDKKYQLLFATIILLSPLRIAYSQEWLSHANWSFILIFLYLLTQFFSTRTFLINPNNPTNDDGHYKNLLGENFTVGAVLGITLGLVYYNHPYHAVIATIITVTLFLFLNNYSAAYRNQWIVMTLKQLFAWGISSLAVLTIITYLWELRSISRGGNAILFNNLTRSPSSVWAYSARPWEYLIPDISNPILGDLSVKIHYWIWQTPPYYLTEPFFPKEHTLFLGFTLIGLSLYLFFTNLVKKWRNTTKLNKMLNLKGLLNIGINFYKAKGVLNEKQNLFFKFFLIIAVTAIIFSMPPYISIKGVRFYFPSYFLYSFLPQFRAYARFGIFAFIANSMIALISLQYILDKLRSSLHRGKSLTILFTLISLLIIVEFARLPLATSISTTPTLPYIWLAEQNGDFGYMEIPRRTDYTDRLYQSVHGKRIVNSYLDVSLPAEISLLEDIIWKSSKMTPDEADIYFCKYATENNILYFFYHEKELNKKKVIREFTKTGIVTKPLKVAMMESWGYPIWGNHVPLTEDDKKNIYITENMKSLLTNDPKFTKQVEFSQDIIAESRPNKNFSADKFDSVTIFKLNSEYCDSILK